uniref:26S proteasome non-ATPase regulatory subunit 5 n=1 Tax=Strigamia maritima TaxID=126957 RepID=T1J7S9_STRMM
MAGSLDALADLLSRLRIDGDAVLILKELKTALLSLPIDDLEGLTRNVSLAPVFDRLNSSDKQQIGLACDLLTSMLTSLPPNCIMPQFQTELHRGLLHPEPFVKEMVLKQIKRCVQQQAFLDNGRDIAMITVRLIGDDNLSVAKHASEVVVDLNKTVTGFNLIFAPSVVCQMKDLLAKNDTVRFRMHEVIVKIATHSTQGLTKCEEWDLLSYILNEYQLNDILIQLNCLELLSDLAMAEHSLYFLETKGVINDLEKLLQQESMNGVSGFLLPGLIKFFGNMAHVRPKEVCEKHPSFINMLFKFIDSNDHTLLLIAIETVSMIGATVDGKITLEKMREMMKNYTKKLGTAIVNAPSELRVKAMNAASILLDLKVQDQTTDMLSLTELWFSWLASEPMQLLLNLCRQPFADIRCAALGILRSLAHQSWGQQKMSLYPGFLEYILDRNTEGDKEGKDLKFEIISILVSSPTSQEIFGTNGMLKLKEYYKQGPYYVFAHAEVAVDGAS